MSGLHCGLISIVTSFVVVVALEVTNEALYEVSFELGNEEELILLYSYPNSDTSNQTLRETVEHYLTQVVERDLIENGLVDVSVSVARDVPMRGDVYSVTITGDSHQIKEYSILMTKFLENGKSALQGVEKLKAVGKWNEEEWRMFLPLGLAICNHRSVQLLHFPPDYSLPQQDYLGSKTSKRWEELLLLNNVPQSEVTLYETILDIAPIAAPASAGSQLKETYIYFQPYVLKMLPFLVENKGKTLPMVAYGGPVCKWVMEFFKLQNFGVNSVDVIKIGELTVPVLGANHPSYIWYAKDDGREKAFKVVEQDLISACWQARMSNDPSLQLSNVLQECQQYWKEPPRPMKVCVAMEKQAYGLSQSEAIKNCRNDFPGDISRDTSSQKIEL
ncbi:uncharacterized protein [Dysidea avara]|uniref:uncharacterized protein n=1 Tax=Dysidea avara TaxID=196820 RepID=UPI003321F642